MPKYIALLRGINVSGQKLIKMEDLRAIFANMGYKNVQTYIQSGNVVFEAPKQDLKKLTSRVEKGIDAALGYHVPTVIRTSDNIKEIVATDTFKKLKANEGTKTYVAFLSDAPTKEQVEYLISLNSVVDTFHVMGSEIYLIIDERHGKSIFTNVFIEKKLKMHATTRNWNTVRKLSEY